MRFCIVSPPTVTEFSKEIAETDAIKTLSEHAPVGVLTLAAILEQRGYDLVLFDSNVLYYQWLSNGGECSTFLEYAAKQILSESFDAIGFGTICSTYPLTLRICEKIKSCRPLVPVILGGPQASAVDIETLSEFTSIDYILRYEAEESLPSLLDALQRGSGVENVKGLTHRKSGTIIRTQSAPAIADLDSVPTPAFHLYPYIEEASYIPLELGRGCPYACTFCSTNDFFRRLFRLKSPERIVSEMVSLKERFGINHFDLIHDMFTVDRKKVVAFCQALNAVEDDFYWNCSARTDRMDPELLDMMHEAGCRAIFYGIETGSQHLQAVIKKNLILEDAIQVVRETSERDINCAVSIITGFPDEKEGDFIDTVDFFARTLRFDNANPQLHILAPLADTPLHKQYKDQLKFDDIVSDMSHQGWDQQSDDRDLILKYPSVFPNFYALPTVLDRERLKVVRAFLLYGARNFGWLLPACGDEAGSVLNLFDGFCSSTDRWADVSYYQTENFPKDFLTYLRENFLPLSANSKALATIVSYFEKFDEVAVDDPSTDVDFDRVSDNQVAKSEVRAFTMESIPTLKENVRLLDCNVDFVEVKRRVTDGESLKGVQHCKITLASRKRPGQWPEVLKLSEKSLELLHACDGSQNVLSIIESIQDENGCFIDIPAYQSVRVGLELLRNDGLLEESS